MAPSATREEAAPAAAMDLFWCNGFNATTIQVVADAGGISRRTVFRCSPPRTTSAGAGSTRTSTTWATGLDGRGANVQFLNTCRPRPVAQFDAPTPTKESA